MRSSLPMRRTTLRGTTPAGTGDCGADACAIHQLVAGKVLLELKDGMSYVHSVVGDIDEERRSELLGEWVRKEGIRVGLKYGVASQWTSFVAGQAFLLFSVSRQQPSSASNLLSAPIPRPVSEQQQQQRAASELSSPSGPFTEILGHGQSRLISIPRCDLPLIENGHSVEYAEILVFSDDTLSSRLVCKSCVASEFG